MSDCSSHPSQGRASLHEGGALVIGMRRWRRTRGERRWSVFEDWAGLDGFDAMVFTRTASRDGSATVEFGMMFVVDTAKGQRAWQMSGPACGAVVAGRVPSNISDRGDRHDDAGRALGVFICPAKFRDLLSLWRKCVWWRGRRRFGTAAMEEAGTLAMFGGKMMSGRDSASSRCRRTGQRIGSPRFRTRGRDHE